MPEPLPLDITSLTKKLPYFKKWLLANGSALLAPTNPFEVLRFPTASGVGVIYKNMRDRVSYVGGAEAAILACLHNRPWHANTGAKKSGSQKRRDHLIASLVDRDGPTCVYCGRMMPDDDITIEHFLSRTHGGNDHLANLMLAHGACNAEASHKSAREKIDFILFKRRMA